MSYGGPVNYDELTEISVNATWTPVVVTSHGVPADATGVIVYVKSDVSNYYGVRAKGDTADRYHDMNDPFWNHIPVGIGTDTSIEIKAENYTQVTFYIVWYFGDEAFFLSTPVDKTPSFTSSSTYDLIDITANLDGADDAIIALGLVHSTNWDEQITVRPYGSSMTYFGGLTANAGMLCPVDSEHRFELRREVTEQSLELRGYIKPNLGWTAYAPTANSTTSAIDDGTYHDLPTIAGDKTAAIYLVTANDDGAKNIYLRPKGGSYEDYPFRVGGDGYGWYIIELDSNGVAEYKQLATTTSANILHYASWELPSLFNDTIDQSLMTKNTYVKIATVAPTDNTLTVTISAAGSAGEHVVVADNVGITLVE